MSEEWKKLERIFNEAILRKVKDIIIVKDASKDSYELFGEYFLSRQPDCIRVTKKNSDVLFDFGSMKSAVTWIALDKRNKVLQSKRIIEIDSKLSSAKLDLMIQERLNRKSADTETKILHLIKAEETRLKIKNLLSELNTFAQEAKEWQLKKFDDSNK